MVGPAKIETSNCRKHQTRNPVVRRLIDRFHRRVAELARPLRAASVLDAGCGEGETLLRLGPELPDDVEGIDINPDCVRFASARVTEARFRIGSLLDLPYPDGRFELVLCLEVLEHLDEPERGLIELSRVAQRDLILSVPHEPYFRLGSLMRGKYIGSLGNHPEHVNHWNPRTFRGFLQRHVQVVEMRRSFPWIIAHARPRR